MYLKIFMGEKLLQIPIKKFFSEKTITDWSLVQPKDATPTNLVDKTFANSHKTLKFAKVFSLEKFPAQQYPLLVVKLTRTHTRHF